MMTGKRIRMGWLLLMICSAAAAPALGAAVAAQESYSGDNPCISESAFLKDRLQGIFRTQLAGGALNFAGDDAWFVDIPLLATFSREAYLIDQDAIFLQRAYASIVGYYNYLFIENDRDGDYLIESARPSHSGGNGESVAYNSLLALDMENLAHISVDLGLPLRALFWFDATRMIKERLVSTSYDPDAGRFASADSPLMDAEGLYGAFSLLPVAFRNMIGDNIATSMLRRYLADPSAFGSRGAEVPSGETGPKNDRIEVLVLRTLIAEMLERNGLESQAASYRAAGAAPSAGVDDYTAVSSGVYDGFWRCRTEHFSRKPLFPELFALDLFAEIARSREMLSASESSAMSRHVDQLKMFIREFHHERALQSGGFDGDPENALSNVRDIYKLISIVRDRNQRGIYFSAADRSEIPGFNLERAFTELINDAILALRGVESMVFVAQGHEHGFGLTCRLRKERSVVGEMIPIEITVSSNRSPERIRSIVLSRGSVIDTLVSRRPFLEIKPQDEPLTAAHSFWVPSDWSPGIHSIPFSVQVLLATGERRTVHFRKSIFVDAPLSFYVSFPEGNTLQQWGVPLDIHLTKRAPYAMSVQTGWFSPSGLSLKEGASQSLYMEEDQADATTRIHVLAPNPVRPGAFPFVLKVFGNGLDMGTVSSTLFKHYQWIFVGPFRAGPDALEKVYPPEIHVNLLEGFNGRDGNVVWGMLPTNVVADNGEILVGDLLDSYGVGYLYTVIKSTRNIRCPAVLAGTAPARLFINGEMVLEANPLSSHPASPKNIFLKEGLNNILVKVAGNADARIYLNLGDDESLTSDEFNNNLWELVDGFKNFYERRVRQFEVASTTQKIVTLRYFSGEAHSVSIIGSFNGWTPDNSPLREVSSGVWEISLHLPPGKYAYRFLVNNSRQVLDPLCPVQEPDGYGGQNSILYLK